MNKKGFSVIELLVSFVVISVIVIGMLNVIFVYRTKITSGDANVQMRNYKNNLTKDIMDDVINKKVKEVKILSKRSLRIYYLDNTSKVLEMSDTSTVDGIVNKSITYGGRVYEVVEKLPDSTNYDDLKNAEVIEFIDNEILVNEEKVGTNNLYNIDINIEYRDLEEDYGIHLSFMSSNEIYVDASGANYPDLASNMIPVVYKNGNWVKANLKEGWYNYTNKIWANAVTVNSDKQEHYLLADSDTVINNDDINSMWVWIPRYEYQKGSNTFNVKFLSGTLSNTTNGYITHPAFDFGLEKLTGIWVAKYESSALGGCTECNSTNINVQIKANQPSWRNLTVSTAYTVSRNMEKNNNIYGFRSGEVDTHLMKNTEWGAVAYFTQSKYGRNSEVAINNNGSYLTGINNSNSTTNSIYGIFDMSGGASEYVMGVMNDSSNKPVLKNSEFTMDQFIKSDNSDESNNFIVSKYYNAYKNGIAATDASLVGTATGETSGWYSDTANIINATYPWFIRGGHKGSKTAAGIFSFDRANGAVNGNIGFRVTLVK